DCDVKSEEVTGVGGQLAFIVDGCQFEIPVWGRHHLNGALSAIAVGRMLGLDLPDMAAALAEFSPVPMRCEVLQLRGATVINDAYNANPASMHAALELVRDFDAPGRRIVVCGDMAELGDDSSRWHFRLGGEVVTVCG